MVATALDCHLLVTTSRTRAGLVFEVVTEETADFQIVVAEDQREVVFPDVEIFTIGPRRLVPDVGITAGAPKERRDLSANLLVAMREHGRNLRRDLVLQRLGF